MADNVSAGGFTFATDEVSGAQVQRIKQQLGRDGVAVDMLCGIPILDVAAGRVSAIAAVNKFGRNDDIDTGTIPEDIWDAGGTWVPPTAARTHDIASTSANDAAAGTGAQTVFIQGLDASWNLQSETVTMNGVSNVATANTYIRIFRMYVATAGSGRTNAGAITATAQTDATVTAQMNAGFGQTEMAIYTVPNGKTAYLTDFYVSLNRSGAAGRADYVIAIRPSADTLTVERVIHSGSLSVTGSSSYEHFFFTPKQIPAKTDIIFRVLGVTDNNTSFSAGYDLILVDD